LRNELKRAVAAEDYEAAARLRDKIKGIELEQGRS
jgi:protein arginine kinase activator